MKNNSDQSASLRRRDLLKTGGIALASIGTLSSGTALAAPPAGNSVGQGVTGMPGNPVTPRVAREIQSEHLKGSDVTGEVVLANNFDPSESVILGYGIRTVNGITEEYISEAPKEVRGLNIAEQVGRTAKRRVRGFENGKAVGRSRTAPVQENAAGGDH